VREVSTSLEYGIVTVQAERNDRGKRLDSLLHERLPEYSRARLQSWIKEGRVLVGDEAAKASYLLRGDECISVEPADLPPLKAEAEDLPLHVLYEDADVVVVDKPAGMVVHAGAGNHQGTLVNALLHHFESLSSVGGDLRPGIVHRLDRDTSGVLVVARTDQAHRALAEQFQTREVEKVYLALVHGQMETIEGHISRPISRDPVRRTRMTARFDTGRSAYTEFKVLERFELFNYLEVRIGTGRTHQIRAHLTFLKHPVVGDSLYAAPQVIPGYPALDRFFLHAHRLRFRSPSADKWITVESPLAPELKEYLVLVREKSPPPISERL
jgi:23S rRNA pseudouridine1911/1915/1917 synthase